MLSYPAPKLCQPCITPKYYIASVFTIVADELDASWKRLDQFLIEFARNGKAVWRSITYCHNTVQLPTPTFSEKLLPIPSLRYDEFRNLRQGLPRSMGAT